MKQIIIEIKRLITTVRWLFAVIIPLVFCACQTAPTTSSGVQVEPIPPSDSLLRLEALARIVAYGGTVFHLQERPDTRVKYELASKELENLLSGSFIHPGELAATLGILGTTELRSDDNTAILIGGVVLLLQDFWQMDPIDTSGKAGAVARGIKEGIDMGLLVTGN